MFKFKGDLDYGIYHIPYEDSRVVITSKKIMNEDFLDDPYYYHYGELNTKAAEEVEETWHWLKFDNNSNNKKVLDRMLKYQEDFPKTIFLCEQEILDYLNKMGIREKFYNWQVLNSDDLEKRLCELFLDQYDKEYGWLLH